MLEVTMKMPEELHAAIKEDAASLGLSVEELLRKFIKLGMLAVQIQKSPDSALIIRDGDTERELLI